MTPWIQTYTGIKFDIVNPTIDMICPEDICIALSNLCRFTGHIYPFYSVAEHSLRVMDLVRDRAKPWAFFHDAAEAYIGDISRPLKVAIDNLMPMRKYNVTLRNIEYNIAQCIRKRFCVSWSALIDNEVMDADNRLLATEARDLFLSAPTDNWCKNWEPLDKKIIPVSSLLAYYNFVDVGIKFGFWENSEVMRNKQEIIR